MSQTQSNLFYYFGPPEEHNEPLALEQAPLELTEEDLLKIFTGDYGAFERWSFAIPGYNPTDLIKAEGYDRANEMLTVGAYASALKVKRYAAIYKGIEFKPLVTKPGDTRYDRAQEAADLVNELTQDIRNEETGAAQSMRSVVWEMTDAFHIGFSVMEKIWRVIQTGKHKGKYGFKRIVAKRPKQIGFYLDAETMQINAIRSYAPLFGYQVGPVRKFLVYVYNPVWGLPYGVGDFRACAKHVYSINELIRIYGIALERFGGPFIVGKTDNPNADYWDMIRQRLDRMRQSASLVVPKTLELEVTYAPNGSMDCFAKAIEMHKTAIVEHVLGQSLTTQQGNKAGSYSQASVHADTQEYFFSAARTDIEWALTQQIARDLVEYNLGPDYLDVIPQASLGNWDSQERNLMADFVTKLTDSGVVNRDEPQNRELLNLDPVPEDGLDADKEAENQQFLAEQSLRVQKQKNSSPKQP